MEDVAKLGFVIDSTQVKQASTELDRMTAAGKRAEQQKDRLGQTVDRMNSRFTSMVSQVRALTAVFAAIAGSQVLRFFSDLFDRMNLVEARLRLVTRSTAELANVQAALFDIAQRSRTEFESTATLYFRIARSADELGKSQAELLRLTEIVNKAIQAGGTSSQEAASGIIQLSQALASGTLRGDELRSVLENMPRLAKAIADGLGVTVGQLRELGAAGKLTSKEIADALLSQGSVIEKEFAQIPRTISGAVTQAVNDFQRLFHEIDKNQNLTQAFTAVVDALKDSFKFLAQYINDSIEEAKRLYALFQQVVDAITVTREERLKEIDTNLVGLYQVRNLEISSGIGQLPADATDFENSTAGRIKALEGERASLVRTAAAEHQLAEAMAAATAATDGNSAAVKRNTELTDEQKRAIEAARKAQLERVLEFEEELAAQDESYENLQKIIDQLKREREAIRLSERERFVRNRLLEAEQIITKELIDDGEKYRKEVRAQAEALFDANKAHQEHQRQLERQAELLDEPFKNAIEGIGDAFTDMFDKVGTDGLDSLGDFADSAKAIFRRLAGEIATLMIIRPIIQQIGIAGGAQGTVAGGGTTSLLGGSGLNLSGLTNLLGLGAGIAGVPAHGAGGVPAGTTMGAGGSGFSGLTAGLGVLSYGLGLLNTDFSPSGPGSNYGQVGGNIGGLIGSIAGSFFGPAGGIVGELRPGLFSSA